METILPTRVRVLAPGWREKRSLSMPRWGTMLYVHRLELVEKKDRTRCTMLRFYLTVQRNLVFAFNIRSQRVSWIGLPKLVELSHKGQIADPYLGRHFRLHQAREDANRRR